MLVFVRFEDDGQLHFKFDVTVVAAKGEPSRWPCYYGGAGLIQANCEDQRSTMTNDLQHTGKQTAVAQ